MLSRLDVMILEARERRDWFVPGESMVNQLQGGFLEDGRFEHRCAYDIVIVEAAVVLNWPRPICYVFDSSRHERRIAVDLVPEKRKLVTNDRTFHNHVLSGGDVDAIVSFAGKDLVHNGKDCQCILARLARWIFTDEGYRHTLTEANPIFRSCDVDPHGLTSVPVAWTDGDGGEKARRVSVRCSTRWAPRRRLAA